MTQKGALDILTQALNIATQKGAFNLNEAVAVGTAIQVLNINLQMDTAPTEFDTAAGTTDTVAEKPAIKPKNTPKGK